MKPTLKEFESYIKKIKEFRDAADKFSEALVGLSDDRRISINGWQEDLMIKLLEKLMEDKDQWISWWIYEKDWGTKKHLAYKLDGKVIPTKTIKDLYNIIK